MSPEKILLLAAASWAVTFAAAPIAARLARLWGFIDRPAGHKSHAGPMPLLGGLALFLGTLVPLLGVAGELAARRFWGFLAAAALVFAAGLWDDRRGLSVMSKFAVQSAAALVLIAAGFQVALPLPGWAVMPLTFLWIVGITNAFNLLDNMDGVSAGVAAVAAVAFLVVAGGSPLALALAATLLGAAFGFLVYNFPPARLFMGDAGSLFLGLGFAALALEAGIGAGGPATGWMLPLLVLAVPIFDTALVSWSRLRRGKNPLTTPGKDHLSHRLLRQGLGVRGAVTALYVLGGLSGVLALAASRGGTALAWGIAGAVVLVALAAVAWLDRPALLESP